MKIIKSVSKGKRFDILVDDDVYEWASKQRWSIHGKETATFYARNGSRKNRQDMHQMLIECPPGMEIDHIDGNGLNNQIDNLRVVTKQQNAQNRKYSARGISKYKGVSCYSLQTRKKPWYARIKVKGNQKLLGYFLTEKEAALAYNKAALEFFGEYAQLNKIKEQNDYAYTISGTEDI